MKVVAGIKGEIETIIEIEAEIELEMEVWSKIRSFVNYKGM